jgi:hypothetical protein
MEQVVHEWASKAHEWTYSVHEWAIFKATKAIKTK